MPLRNLKRRLEHESVRLFDLTDIDQFHLKDIFETGLITNKQRLFSDDSLPLE